MYLQDYCHDNKCQEIIKAVLVNPYNSDNTSMYLEECQPSNRLTVRWKYTEEFTIDGHVF